MKMLRHGDLLLVKVNKIPSGLKKSRKRVLMRGSNNNDHKINANADVYFKKVDDFVFGYIDAKKGCVLTHKDHGEKTKNKLRKAVLPVGLYEMRKQVEKTHQGMRPVVD